MNKSNLRNLNKMTTNDVLPIILFLFSLCFFSFIYGMIASSLNLFPSSTVKQGIEQWEEFVSRNRPHHLFPIKFHKTGVTILKQDKMMPGITLLTSHWKETGWTAGIRLIDEHGATLHHWEINPKKIWPKSPHNDILKNARSKKEYVHGTYLYPNGDILFNIEYLGLVRMNCNGKILWKLPYRTHHSIFRDEEGNFWVPGIKWIEDGNERAKLFPGMVTPFIEEKILKISPEGKILIEISFMESIFNGGYKHLFWHYSRFQGDVLHINDVEVLGTKLADGFSIFNAGDIVISSANLSIIAVLNQSGKIKWLCSGIFTRQHDPDFEQNGWIAVFDNRTGLDQSQIRAINPATNEVFQLYPTEKKQFFYTHLAGKHQRLDNGNRLITEARTGRVFEVTPQGETVWEWIQQPYNDKVVAEITEATRYSIDKNDISNWNKIKN